MISLVEIVLSLKLLDSANLEEILKGSDLSLGARKILDYHLDLIRKQSPLNRKAVRYSCNESITSPDGVCDEEPIHSIIPETSEQNSIEVCTNIDMVIWINAALKSKNIVVVLILCHIFFELGCEYGISDES